jgi:protoheme ferro-lyase
MKYDALLVVSFGGPESSDEVIPFLENVLRDKNVPRERMLAVAEHYYHFGGRSPIKQRDLAASVVIAPIGFISAHMEVVYDLDTEAKQLCEDLQLPMVLVGTLGTHPRFVRMIRERIEERMSEEPVRIALGALAPSHDTCPTDCCPASQRPAQPGRA